MSSGARLRVLDDDVEVAVVVEHAGVEQLVLHVLLAAARVGRDQIHVRERALRVLVLALEVGVGRGAVEVEPVLLDVLAVVALAVGEPEHPLLQDRVGAVPERERQAQPLALVADSRDPVLAPPVSPRARLVVREVVPGVAVVAVVLADRAPLALAQVRAPGLPGCGRPCEPARGACAPGCWSSAARPCRWSLTIAGRTRNGVRTPAAPGAHRCPAAGLGSREIVVGASLA